MGSRRMPTRSFSANGRSMNGDGVSGSSRAGGCSYLSNVRPENRTTLCSVIAQLTEETQPSFETTLKSRAVSENCTVKFSCAVTGHPTPQVVWYKDDMQLDRFCGLPKYEIFRNGKSHSLHIYNCTVEDAAIYQASASNVKGIVSCSGVLEVGEMNEFKIHQRYFAKIKQKAEHRCREAEGKENLEPLRTISPERTQRKRRSTTEAFLSAPSSTEDEGDVETEARLQEAAVDDGQEKLLPVTGGAAPAAVSAAVNENGNIHDSAQKVFTAHQQKTSLSVKKKIKISNSAKADVPGERVSEEHRTKDNSAESARSSGTSEEVRVVGNMFNPPAVDSNAREQKCQKSATNEATPRRNVRAAPPQRDQLALTSKTPSQEKSVGPEVTKGKSDNHSPYRTSSKPKASAPPSSLEAGAVLTVDMKADSSTGSLLHRRFESAERPHPNRTTLPQRPCEQAGDQLSEKEASQENPPDRPSEASQAQTQATRNDAPVGLELPPSWRMREAKPPARKTQLKRESTKGDTQAFSGKTGLPPPIDNPTQGACDRSRGSSESNTVLVPSLRKPPLESPDGGEDARGSEASPTSLQIHQETSAKSGDGTEMWVDVKVEGKVVGSILQPDDSVTESTALQNVEQNKEKKTEMMSMPKTAEKHRSELQMVKPDESEPAQPRPAITFRSTSKLEEIKEIPKPVSKVLSIAELLRAQLTALDVTLMNSVPSPITTGTETCQQVTEEDGKRYQEAKTKEQTDVTNTNAALMETYHLLNTDSSTELNQTPPVEALPKPLLIPPVFGLETTGLQKSTVCVMDVGKETDASKQVPQINDLVVALTEREHVQDFRPLTSADELSRGSGSGPGKVSSQTQSIEPVQHQELSSESESGTRDMRSPTAADRSKMDDHSTNSGSSQSRQRFPIKSATEGNQPQQNSSTSKTSEASPVLKRRNSVSPVPSATPEELASGARRKVLTPKTKPEEATEATSPAGDPTQTSKLSTGAASLSASPSLSRRSPLLQPSDERTSPVERRSPLVSRRQAAPETPAPNQQLAEDVCSQKSEGKPAVEKKQDPFKAPQVIRKIRSETFADASGHLKLWCQFFNVLSDSTITWYKNEEEIAHMKRKAGDETQVNLAIVQTSRRDSGVYRCSVTNDHGTDSTDLLLGADILTGTSRCEDLGVGEEIEMTPLIFSRGVSDAGVWGSRLFGRIVMQESHVGDGCSHKAWRAKVIYGLEPVFESGQTCMIKVPNPIPYGGKEDGRLVDRNLETVQQGCKIQNLAREYCKIFSAEARLVESFGPCLEVIPVYLMYRPANPVPYATVEADLTGVYQKYSFLDHTGRIDTRSGSWVEQKCCALQHWIHQWTNGNLLLTRLEGVDTKITNVGISVKSTGHQGLPIEGNPKVFEQFVSLHQCNYFCGLLGLRSLKVMDSLTVAKPKTSRSPLLQRKTAAGSSSPQTGRKAAGSPRLPWKAEQEGRKTPTKPKAADAPKNPQDAVQ